jgi:sortase A
MRLAAFSGRLFEGKERLAAIDQLPHRAWAARIEAALWALAVLGLGVWAYVHVERSVFEVYQGRKLANLAAAPGPATPQLAPPTPGELIGRLTIDRVGVSAIVVEGVEQATLRRGAGHLPGTALPGSGGNVAIAGHRDTDFRGLEDVEQGDRIDLETPRGRFVYVVESTAVVPPDAVEELAPRGHSALTLITCHPFNFVGPAPDRYVVRARERS